MRAAKLPPSLYALVSPPVAASLPKAVAVLPHSRARTFGPRSGRVRPGQAQAGFPLPAPDSEGRGALRGKFEGGVPGCRITESVEPRTGHEIVFHNPGGETDQTPFARVPF